MKEIGMDIINKNRSVHSGSKPPYTPPTVVALGALAVGSGNCNVGSREHGNNCANGTSVAKNKACNTGSTPVVSGARTPNK
jgi:hypothetical protein